MAGKFQLNPAQAEAVKTIKGPLLILAGAGSGKTRVITSRTIGMLSSGIPAKNILCLTFTNKAADEMRERIKEELGANVKAPRICTFHSLCLWVLTRESSHLGFRGKFSIYDSSDQKQILFEVLKEMKIDFNDEIFGIVHRRISNAKNNNLGVDEYPIEDEIDKAIQKIYCSYQEALRQFNAFDFDDLIFYTNYIFSNFPEILKKYQRRFKYIMIDEYQDTNHAQYVLARQLSATSQNIAVVGDDDQSIYSWRGADIRNILDFEKDYPGAKVIKLEENYRSSQTILEAANAVIKNNTERKEKTLRSVFGRGENIQTMESLDPCKEAEAIADDISLKVMKHNRSYRDFAVLFRTNSQSRWLEDIFIELKIPFHVSGKLDFWSKKEIKDALAYFKLINNPDDDISFLRVINYPKRGAGPSTLKSIKNVAMNYSTSLFKALEAILEEQPKALPCEKELKHFTEIIRGYQNDSGGKGMAGIFRDFLHNIDFNAEILKEKLEPKFLERKLQNLQQLIDSIDVYARRTPEPTMQDFLIKLALHLSNDEEEEEMNENAVQFLTIHSAKGLEFPYLYIIGFEEEMLPFVKDENTPCDLDEERRLCYVAITRAKKELTLSLCRERTRMRETVLQEPSRFLDEIPDELIDRNYGLHDSPKKEKKEEDISEIGFEKLRSIFKD